MPEKNDELCTEQDGYMKEEDGELIYDLRSLDLCELTVHQLELACCKENYARPLEGSPFMGVTQLLLDHNDLEEIPDQIREIKSLKKLSVIGNQLYHIPDCVGKLLELEVLNLNENNVDCLPVSINSLEKLKILSVVANRIKLIEDGVFSQLKRLKELYLDENLLNSLPNDFCHLESLQVFECSENQLLSLPEDFGDLHNLCTLNLDSNRISNLPESFSMLGNLKILLLSENNLRRLPNVFKSACKLEKLIISKNGLCCTPDWFGDLQNIKELAVDDNELQEQVFSEAFSISASEIRSLSAGRNYITKLPENIGCLQKLTVLHLGSTMHELERSNFQSGNWLSTLPESFTNLINLKKLRLDENQIRFLPNEIGNLKKLEWLDLGQNQLVSLPDSFCELTKLTYLQLSKNRLKFLPVNIGNLDKLIELHLDSNMLTEIPDSISKLSLLHSLDLFHNCLKEFPNPVMYLKNLKRLDVERNEFSTSNLPKLIEGNVYPERDESLKDNWRGRTRDDKKKCEVIKMPEFEKETQEEIEEDEMCYNENALIHAMRAGMALWKHHNGPTERNVPANSVPLHQDNLILPADTVENVSNPLNMDPPSQLELNEDWDEELKSENYKDTIETYTGRKDTESVLIDSFQNNVNRYPPCLQAFSPTACYDSLVYKKSSKRVDNKSAIKKQEGEEGQFDDAED